MEIRVTAPGGPPGILVEVKRPDVLPPVAALSKGFDLKSSTTVTVLAGSTEDRRQPGVCTMHFAPPLSDPLQQNRRGHSSRKGRRDSAHGSVSQSTPASVACEKMLQTIKHTHTQKRNNWEIIVDLITGVHTTDSRGSCTAVECRCSWFRSTAVTGPPRRTRGRSADDGTTLEYIL